MSNNIIKGREGEDLALKFLEEKGYKIKMRNYRSGRGEIDLIAEKGNVLVFLEVKFRSSAGFGMPEEAVDEKKANLIIDTAENYILEYDWKGEVRFDIISLRGKKEILHLQDAF